jgi:hypothetical protein
MAIIPADEKVFMVDKRTNTIYGGSAALQAMQQWYTMQDVIDTVDTGGVAPTLQQVTDEGNTTNTPITVDVSGGDNAITGISVGGYGLYGESVEETGVYGVSQDGWGGYFYSPNGAGGVYGSSPDSPGVYGYSSDGYGVQGYANENYGIYGGSQNNIGGFFTSDVSYSLVAAQSAAKPGGGSWSVYSDSRLKENIVPYTKGLSDILLINPVTYEYNGLANTIKGNKYTGIIAQEIKEVFPDTVNTYKAKLNEEDEGKTELYDFNASDLTFALINAIKELKTEIDLLKSK